MARAARFEAAGIAFVDAGVSGGTWGLANGYSLTLGGSEDDVAALERVFRALAPHPGQWLRCGPAGAGHFVKMIHNGIEYGLMQAYAEGFALMKDHPDFDLDLAAISGTWLQGGVVRSWLLELARDFLAEDASLEGVAPVVADSGEGRWTAQEAIDRGVPAPVITAALMQRFASQGGGDFAARVLAMMRNRFGGHAVGEDR
jgi:6-phosphogluconate dehydrogenase